MPGTTGRKGAEPKEVPLRGLRENKRIKVRARLEESAFRLFLEQGYDSTTMSKIADEAQVSRRTLFRHFRSKDAIPFARSREHLAVVQDSVEHRPQDEPDELALQAAMVEYAEYLEQNKRSVLPGARLIFETRALYSRRAEEMARWREALAQSLAARAGLIRPRVRDTVLAAASLAAFDVALQNWIESSGERSLSQIVREVFATLSPG